jgi:uncharacterized membrane protein
MLIRTPEAHSRSIAKAISWRVVGSLDTFFISWFVTGKLTYAGMILSIETFTKIAIYYGHEQFWAWVPWWKPAPKAETEAATSPVTATLSSSSAS